jgi:RNA polymerase sigma-70 factor (ECF subfamily)
MVAVMKGAGTPTRAEFHAAIATRSDRWYAACLKITRNPDLAEDAVQEALLSAWDKRHQFQHTARLDTWIHRIAVNAALQLLRKNRPGVFEPLESDPVDENQSEMPEAAQHDHDISRALSVAMKGLSEIERVTFVLKHLEQWRLKEIAAELNVGVDTVKQAIFRAVRKLRVSATGLRGNN